MGEKKKGVSNGDTIPTGMTQFGFEGAPVLALVGEDDMPWFNANDVCKALGYMNTKQTLDDHVDEDDVSKRYTIDRIGRTQRVNFVNESGLYALIFGSGKPLAKRFKRWVTSVVLPTIRKTGSYGQPVAATEVRTISDVFALTPECFARMFYALGKALGPAAVIWQLAKLGAMNHWVEVSLRQLSQGMGNAIGTTTVHRQLQLLQERGLVHMERDPTRIKIDAEELTKLLADVPEYDMRPGLAMVEMGLVTLH
jgi:prophage antirepressor-like protein